MIASSDESSRFKPGDYVRVIDGYFARYKGTVDHVDFETDTVTVMIDVFGQPNPVELAPKSLEKTGDLNPDPGSPQAGGES